MTLHGMKVVFITIDMELAVPSFWFASWYDVSITPNIALFNHVRNNAKDAEIRDNQYLVIATRLCIADTHVQKRIQLLENAVSEMLG